MPKGVYTRSDFHLRRIREGTALRTAANKIWRKNVREWNESSDGKRIHSKALINYNKSNKGRETSSSNGKKNLNRKASDKTKLLMSKGRKGLAKSKDHRNSISLANKIAFVEGRLKLPKDLMDQTSYKQFIERKKNWMLNGGATYVCSFNKTPSKPQVELFNLSKGIYEDAVLNYPCLNYSIDVAIPSLKIAMEYDGSYWHQDKEKDMERQLKIEQQGWQVIRFRDYIPTDRKSVV